MKDNQLKLIKDLREATGAGILDCKKALLESKNNLKESIKWLRTKGIAKAAKKINRHASEGIINIIENKNKILIVEVNSETDFVSKNEKFTNLITTISKTMINKKNINKSTPIKDVLEFKVDEEHNINDLIINNIAVIGENINLKRFDLIQKNNDEAFAFYIHNNMKIGVVLLFDNKNVPIQIARQICMHVAALDPRFISVNDVSNEFIDEEKSIINQKMINDQSVKNKPESIIEKIIIGKLNKIINEQCLVEQNFVVDPNKKVKDVLKEYNSNILIMTRFQVGEGQKNKKIALLMK